MTRLLSLKFHFQFLEDIICWLVCLHPSNYLWPSACGPMVQKKPFVVSFAEQRNGLQILTTQGIFTVVCTMYEGKISKTDINRKKKIYFLRRNVIVLFICGCRHVCICACVWVQAHMEARGQSCFLISTVFLGDGDGVFHCSRTHQVMGRLVGVENPENPLPGWHFPVLKLLLDKLFIVWILRTELRYLACKVRIDLEQHKN